MSEYKGSECPVCGGLRFSRCDKCGWWSDPYQQKNADEGGLTNLFSLNHAKELYKKEHRPLDEIAREMILAKRRECEEKGIPWGIDE